MTVADRSWRIPLCGPGVGNQRHAQRTAECIDYGLELVVGADALQLADAPTDAGVLADALEAFVPQWRVELADPAAGESDVGGWPGGVGNGRGAGSVLGREARSSDARLCPSHRILDKPNNSASWPQRFSHLSCITHHKREKCAFLAPLAQAQR